jgi:hypothetical protein
MAWALFGGIFFWRARIGCLAIAQWGIQLGCGASLEVQGLRQAVDSILPQQKFEIVAIKQSSQRYRPHQPSAPSPSSIFLEKSTALIFIETVNS